PLRLRQAAAALALALAIGTACAGQPGTARAPVDDAFAALLANSTDLGATDPGRQVQLVLTLQDPAATARAARLQATYTPGSPDFGKPMTPAEYDRAFGPDPVAVKSLAVQLQNRNLASDWRPGDTFLTISGSAAMVDGVFATDIHDYRARSGRRFYASPRDPRIPSALQGTQTVTAAAHLTDYGGVGIPTPKNVPPGGLRPADLAVAYDYQPLRDQGLDGTGEQVVFVEVDGFEQADLDTFNTKF